MQFQPLTIVGGADIDLRWAQVAVHPDSVDGFLALVQLPRRVLFGLL